MWNWNLCLPSLINFDYRGYNSRNLRSRVSLDKVISRDNNNDITWSDYITWPDNSLLTWLSIILQVASNCLCICCFFRRKFLGCCLFCKACLRRSSFCTRCVYSIWNLLYILYIICTFYYTRCVYSIWKLLYILYIICTFYYTCCVYSIWKLLHILYWVL